MSVALIQKYRDQYIATFERRQSVLREAVTTDTESNAAGVYFLIAGSGGRSAVTRGSNGLIPPSDDSQTQVPITFVEAQDLNEKTNFNIFQAQGNQLELMRMNGVGVINRAIDAAIITAIASGTVTLGAVGTMNIMVAQRVATILRNAFVGESDRGNIYALLSPAAFAYMELITQFSNVDYTATKKIDDGIPQLGMWKYWFGINWGEHSGLTGVGTTSTCLAWHKAAVGHAIASGGIDAEIGRDGKQDTSWARHTVYHGAAKLQNSGIVKWTHDDTGLSA
jgi:hypothetical protein